MHSSRRIGDGRPRRLQAARFPGRIGRRPRPDSPSQNWSGVRAPCEAMPRSKRSGVRPIGRWRTFGSGHAEETCRSRIFHSADRGSFTRTRVKRPADRGSFTRTRVKRPADRGSFPQAVVKRPADRGTLPTSRIPQRPRPDSPRCEGMPRSKRFTIGDGGPLARATLKRPADRGSFRPE